MVDPDRDEGGFSLKPLNDKSIQPLLLHYLPTQQTLYYLATILKQPHEYSVETQILAANFMTQ